MKGFFNFKNSLKIMTGRGNHSANGVSVLNKGLFNFFKKSRKSSPDFIKRVEKTIHSIIVHFTKPVIVENMFDLFKATIDKTKRIKVKLDV